MSLSKGSVGNALRASQDRYMKSRLVRAVAALIEWLDNESAQTGTSDVGIRNAAQFRGLARRGPTVKCLVGGVTNGHSAQRVAPLPVLTR